MGGEGSSGRGKNIVTRYRQKCHCKSCGHVWTRYADAADSKPKKCPNKKCGQLQMSIGFDPTSGRAPGIVGANNSVKAVDMAAQIAMEDYGLTDLKDNVRPGESMAPPLAPVQQQKADSFFSGGKAGTSKRQQMQTQRLFRRAIGGAFRSAALDVKSVLPDNRVALRKIRTEVLNPKQ